MVPLNAICTGQSNRTRFLIKVPLSFLCDEMPLKPPGPSSSAAHSAFPEVRPNRTLHTAV